MNADGNLVTEVDMEKTLHHAAVDDAADVMSGVNNTLLPNELKEEEKEELEFQEKTRSTA